MNYFFSNVNNDCWKRIEDMKEFKTLSPEAQKIAQGYFKTMLACNEGIFRILIERETEKGPKPLS